jgi:hypothetical protein
VEQPHFTFAAKFSSIFVYFTALLKRRVVISELRGAKSPFLASAPAASVFGLFAGAAKAI